MQSIKLIDLFAGPGGLGEGFASYNKFGRFFPSVSVEMDQAAASTLRFRKLFHLLQKEDGYPENIYWELFKNPARIQSFLTDPINAALAERVDTAIWEHELGSMTTDQTCREIQSRLDKLDAREQECVLIGGPPCQAYSVTGRSRRKQMQARGDYVPEDDERHFLYEWYLKFLPRFRPAVFIMENVPGIISSKIHGGFIIEKILDDLQLKGNRENLRYKLFPLIPITSQSSEGKQLNGKAFQINAEQFGIPQARKRVIIMGVRSDLLSTGTQPGSLEQSSEITAGQVLTGMPRLRSGISKIRGKNIRDTEQAWKKEICKGWNGIRGPIKDKVVKAKIFDEYIPKIKDLELSRGGEFLECENYSDDFDESLPTALKNLLHDPRLSGYGNSTTRSHMDSDLKRYLFNAVFTEVKGKPPLLDDYPERLLPDHKNVKTGKYKDRFRTINSDKPSKTITSHIAKDGHAFIHYDPLQCRSLTVREAARLQAFPDNYLFRGNRTQQYHQVGNAVPPYLAFQIAGIVSNFLKGAGI